MKPAKLSAQQLRNFLVKVPFATLLDARRTKCPLRKTMPPWSFKVSTP